MCYNGPDSMDSMRQFSATLQCLPAALRSYEVFRLDKLLAADRLAVRNLLNVTECFLAFVAIFQNPLGHRPCFEANRARSHERPLLGNSASNRSKILARSASESFDSI